VVSDTTVAANGGSKVRMRKISDGVTQKGDSSVEVTGAGIVTCIDSSYDSNDYFCLWNGSGTVNN